MSSKEVDAESRLCVAAYIGQEQGLLEAECIIMEAAVLLFKRDKRDDEACRLRALALRVGQSAHKWRTKAHNIDGMIPLSE